MSDSQRKRRRSNRSPRRTRSRHFAPLITFKDLDFGADDANIEWEVSKHAGHGDPIFIKAFFEHPLFEFSEFRSGRRFFVLGQKGTGKTAVLRKIQAMVEAEGGSTHFMIFRDEVASKDELDRFGSIFAVSVNDVQKTHHHLYTLERMILLILASQLDNIVESVPDFSDIKDDSTSTTSANTTDGLKEIFKRVIGQPVRRAVETALDTVAEAAKIVQITPEKLDRLGVQVDSNVLLRRLNERMLEACLVALRNRTSKIAIFIDEIHFTYRTGKDHELDAALVRDLIRAVSKINRELGSVQAVCRVYAAIRSEYLQNPIIAAAELHSTLIGYGRELTWSTFNADFSHPMFEIGARRVDANLHQNMNGRDFMKACFANFTNDDAIDFVQSTWSKPRDMIRFLRTCKEMYPGKITLSQAEYRQVFHQACISARVEIETALTSFLTIAGVEATMRLLSDYSSRSLEKGNIGKIDEFCKSLNPIVKKEVQVGAFHESQTLFRILYMLGAIYTVRPVIGQRIPVMHSFHRGNPNPDPDGFVAIHRGVAKSFS